MRETQLKLRGRYISTERKIFNNFIEDIKEELVKNAYDLSTNESDEDARLLDSEMAKVFEFSEPIFEINNSQLLSNLVSKNNHD